MSTYTYNNKVTEIRAANGGQTFKSWAKNVTDVDPDARYGHALGGSFLRTGRNKLNFGDLIVRMEPRHDGDNVLKTYVTGVVTDEGIKQVCKGQAITKDIDLKMALGKANDLAYLLYGRYPLSAMPSAEAAPKTKVQERVRARWPEHTLKRKALEFFLTEPLPVEWEDLPEAEKTEFVMSNRSMLFEEADYMDITENADALSELLQEVSDYE